MKICFSKSPERIGEVFDLIAQTPTGLATLKAFIPSFESGRVKIQNYPQELVDQLRSVLGPGQPIGACFVNDADHGTIHVDMRSPLGVLAPFLLHEMVHSLDDRLWRMAGRRAKGVRVTRKIQDQIMLQVEKQALDTQHQFVQELGEKFPTFREFLVQQFPRVKILHERLTEQDIGEHYGIGNW